MERMSDPNPYRPSRIDDPNDLRSLQSHYPKRSISRRSILFRSAVLLLLVMGLNVFVGSSGRMFFASFFVTGMICAVWFLFSYVED